MTDPDDDDQPIGILDDRFCTIDPERWIQHDESCTIDPAR